jgi:hypothetical protein
VQFAIRGRVYADTPDEGPDWGVRAGATLLISNGPMSSESSPANLKETG